MPCGPRDKGPFSQPFLPRERGPGLFTSAQDRQQPEQFKTGTPVEKLTVSAAEVLRRLKTLPVIPPN
ncbi:hypothetical protein CEXT_343061 [Caerostris extrusa]|uniref:Uncharacterized protein n=1 Tax=Caerostris extrusa TaxID=172846 RepID=A0AAV4SG91_CAEEX|nr:hypothetical protein CEXT_343061 [Caerostris extrusa]